MNFKELLMKAKNCDQQAREALVTLYRPLLIKEAIVEGVFDEDLYQEFCETLLHCIDCIQEFHS